MISLILFTILSFQVKSQCQLCISADTVVSKSCKYSIEGVIWENEINTTASGNNIEKTSGTNNWNADATSLNMVFNNGFVQTIADEITTNRMIGLNEVNGSSNFTELEYAFFLRNNGELSIYESGKNLEYIKELKQYFLSFVNQKAMPQ